MAVVNCKTAAHNNDDDDDDDDRDGTKDDDKNNNMTIRPFEWLTSPLSLKALLEEHVAENLAPRVDDNDNDKSNNDDKKDNKKYNNIKYNNHASRVLHVGSGSSTVGEFLLKTFHCSLVVDLDKDEATVEQMKRRWEMLLLLQKEKEEQHEQQTIFGNYEFCSHDFTTSPIPFENDYFDLILDKSTLDCTLCSDYATAHLLQQVYRTLQVGGVYIVISFHEIELLLPLLQDMPGASWHVTTTTMPRQVETIPTTDSSSQSLFTTNVVTHHSETKPLNVLMARKREAYQENTTMEFDAICQHVHRVNDTWFQTHQPLLTQARTCELQQAFFSPLEENSNNNNASSSSSSSSSSLLLPLPQAYQVMFTDAEREHLSYEHFLEDWEAFCNDHQQEETTTTTTTNIISINNNADTKRKNPTLLQDAVAYDLALLFLKVMQ